MVNSLKATLFVQYVENIGRAMASLNTSSSNLPFQNLLNMPLSEDLCEFVGAVIGDGSIDGYVNVRGKSKHHIFITGHAEDDLDYLTNRICQISETCFHKAPRIRYRKPSTIILNYYSKPIFDLLTKRLGFIPGKKVYTVVIPNEILNSHENFLFATIRGIFDTDGGVYLDRRKIYRHKYPRIMLRIASEPLFSQLKFILGKYFSLYTAKKYAKNTKFVSYEIVVYGQKQVDLWMQLIGFSNKRHLTRLKPEEGIEPTTCGLQNRCSTN